MVKPIKPQSIKDQHIRLNTKIDKCLETEQSSRVDKSKNKLSAQLLPAAGLQFLKPKTTIKVPGLPESVNYGKPIKPAEASKKSSLNKNKPQAKVAETIQEHFISSEVVKVPAQKAKKTMKSFKEYDCTSLPLIETYENKVQKVKAVNKPVVKPTKTAQERHKVSNKKLPKQIDSANANEKQTVIIPKGEGVSTRKVKNSKNDECTVSKKQDDSCITSFDSKNVATLKKKEKNTIQLAKTRKKPTINVMELMNTKPEVKRKSKIKKTPKA